LKYNFIHNKYRILNIYSFTDCWYVTLTIVYVTWKGSGAKSVKNEISSGSFKWTNHRSPYFPRVINIDKNPAVTNAKWQ